MKKFTSVILLILSLVMIVSAMTIGASASSAYQTYTYSISGFALYSPDAYSAEQALVYTDMGLPMDFKNPKDMITDKDGNIYIADTDNNQIAILNRYFEFQTYITTFYNAAGNNDRLVAPQGVFVTDDSIWVCDTGNTRLVEFDKKTLEFKQIIDPPESQLLSDNAAYKPVAMAIDPYGRIYVVSSSTNQGIIVMNSEGDFVGFIGAQAVTISAWEILWRSIQTDAQRKASATKTSVIYNNIAISDEGFIYVTTSGIKESSVATAITGKDRTGKYAPVKMLNPSGDEIMRRNGFWPPAGEINFKTSGGVSTLVDVATGPEKTWSIVDTKREKIYTYDFNGNLLFAFGDTGTMLGSISNVCAIAYQGTKMLILDSGSKSIIVYNRTEYGDLLIQAIAAENSLDYDYAIQCWEKVLQRNSNFDAAYVGIGNALYRSADYEEALEYYEKAYDTTNWSESYKMVRKEWMSVWLLPIVGLIIVLVVLIIKFLGWAAKVNKRAATDGRERKSFWEEIIYGFYVIFHPFDGFYDLKHEKRGSVRASLVFIGLTILSFFYQGIGQGYVVNPTGGTSTLWSQAISILVPLFLFVLANWCLTTLFEGEGSFKDIFIASSYSLLPLILFVVPATLGSNWVSLSEVQLIDLLIGIAFVWTIMLLFFGTMVTHDYPLFKNLIIILFTIVAMAFIVFLVLLFGMLLSKLVSLVTNIVTEIQYRA